jgi:hypothetical protein
MARSIHSLIIYEVRLEGDYRQLHVETCFFTILTVAGSGSALTAEMHIGRNRTPGKSNLLRRRDSEF